MDAVKLICKGTHAEMIKWLIDNRPDIFDKFFGAGTYTAIIEHSDGDIQRGVWSSEEEMNAALNDVNL